MHRIATLILPNTNASIRLMTSETRQGTAVGLSPESKSALVNHLKTLVDSQGIFSIKPLFEKPASLDDFAQIVASCLKAIDVFDPFDKIVLTRLIEPGVGLLPTGGSISTKLNKPLVIYTEPSGLLRTEPYIAPERAKGKAAFLDHNPKDYLSAITIVGNLFEASFDKVVYIALINGDSDIEKDLRVVADMIGKQVSFHFLATKEELDQIPQD